MGALGGASGEDLTPLGRWLGRLPLDPRPGLIVTLGRLYGCLDPCVTVACAMSYRDPFVISTDEIRRRGDELRRHLCGGTGSEHWMMHRLFQVRERERESTLVCDMLRPMVYYSA
jgi:HrpA-like RNA helicase